MPKLVIGKTPEQIAAEEAEKQREREIQIQQKNMEQQAKIEAMRKKQRQTKAAIIAVASILTVALLTFGTYNTFIRHNLTEDDMRPVVSEMIAASNFPSEGLDNYIRDNCDGFFERYYRPNNASSDIADIYVDKNSCNISRVKKLSSTLAQVYFSFDVVTQRKDFKVTDPAIISAFTKQGYLQQEEKPTEPETKPEEPTTENEEGNPEETPEENSENSENPEVPVEENSEENTSNGENQPNDNATPEGNIASDTKSANAATFSSNISGTVENYYITASGEVMQVGRIEKERYNFYMPVEYFIKYSKYVTDDDGKTVRAPDAVVVGGGYRPAGDMTLYTLDQADMTGEEFKNNPDAVYYYSAFYGNIEEVEDENTTNLIRTKVDNVLSDLYAGKDTSFDFKNFKKFNSFDAEYNGLNDIIVFKDTNALDVNTYVKYTIKTTQGFIFEVNAWMKVEENGSTYVITNLY